jgi:uncharacterized membrane protein
MEPMSRLPGNPAEIFWSRLGENQVSRQEAQKAKREENYCSEDLDHGACRPSTKTSRVGSASKGLMTQIAWSDAHADDGQLIPSEEVESGSRVGLVQSIWQELKRKSADASAE